MQHDLIDTSPVHSGLVKGVAKVGDIAEEDMNIMFQTNVTGLINMTQAVMAVFRQRPNGGAGDVINVGSIAGREPYAGGGIYCATKAAVRSFTESMRKELIATRIRVIEIDPGQVETVCFPPFLLSTCPSSGGRGAALLRVIRETDTTIGC